jgi:signal transduction histidine kinase
MLDNQKIFSIICIMQEHHGLALEGSGNIDKQLKKRSANSARIGRLGFGLIGKSIIQSLPTGVVVFDADLKIIENNPQAAKLLDLDDYIDSTLAKGTSKSSSSRQEWTGRLKSVVSTGQTNKFESVNYRFSNKDKTKSLRLFCIPLLAGEGSSIENLNYINQSDYVKRADNTNKENKTHHETAGTGGALIIEDITEKTNIQRQLTGAQKLATVGKLASKVAHELNNPMDGILRYVNLALRIVEQEKLEKPKEYLSQCRQGLMRMVHIINELLEFSRSTYALTEEYADIEQIIEDAIKMTDMRTESTNISVLRNYRPGIPQIKCGNLFQVFYNLVKNALDSMPDGGELRISTMPSADNYITVEFSDTGGGFAPENAEAIFEPFFTTKDKGKGTGLGLAICREIIERCHGRITAENAPGGGSVFTVYLPVTNED